MDTHPLFQTTQFVSFDVFDTVLTRATAEPCGVFMLLARSLGQVPDLCHLAEDFPKLRMRAEEVSRGTATLEEITLSNIYRTLSEMISLSPEQQELLCRLEEDVERSVSRPIEAILQIIAKLRCEGKRILFISDMYLSDKFILELLTMVGAFVEGDGLYVSSRYQRTKRSGNLFKFVLDKEGVSPHELLHVGDNPHSDLKIPRNLGIPVFSFLDAKLTCAEQILLQGDSSVSLDLQMMAGASRCARVASFPFSENRLKALYEAGASIAGPILSSFVAWVLRQAQADRLERLYFVARDGQVLRLIAQQMENECDGIELCYLYGSRQAWHLPGTFVCNAVTADWLLLADPYLSLEVIAQRGRLEHSEFIKALKCCGFPALKIDQRLTESEIVQLRELVCRSSPLKTLLEESACKARSYAVAYFQQEGLFDDVHWGIVDLGWHGNLQNSLERILVSAGSKPPKVGYYFGLLSRPPSDGSKKSYFFNADRRDDYFAWGSACIAILELLASGDHGTTQGYRQMEDGTVQPEIDLMNKPVLGWGLEYLRKGIFRYVRESPFHMEDSAQTRSALLPLVRWFCVNPPKEIAEALGSFPFSSDQAEVNRHPFAPPLSLPQALFYLINFGRPSRFEVSYWIHGSRVQSGVLTNILLSFASKLFWFVNGLTRKSSEGK